MASKTKRFYPGSIVGKNIDCAFDIIYSDIEYNGTTKFYWLSVPISFDNMAKFIRFPYGSEFSIVWNDNGIVTKIY